LPMCNAASPWSKKNSTLSLNNFVRTGKDDWTGETAELDAR
jgi:hypothetical protein